MEENLAEYLRIFPVTENFLFLPTIEISGNIKIGCISKDGNLKFHQSEIVTEINFFFSNCTRYLQMTRKVFFVCLLKEEVVQASNTRLMSTLTLMRMIGYY